MTTALAHHLIARTWLSQLITETGAEPPTQTRRDLTALLTIAVSEMIDGDEVAALQIVAEVRRLLARWPGLPPAGGAALDVEYTIITPVAA